MKYQDAQLLQVKIYYLCSSPSSTELQDGKENLKHNVITAKASLIYVI